MTTKKAKKTAMRQINARVPDAVLERLERRAAAMSEKARVNITVGALVRSILEEHA